MIKKLKQHFFSIIIIGIILVSCIYTGSIVPFFVIVGSFSLIGIIIAITHIIVNRKVNVYIIKEKHFVSDDRFEQDFDETLH